MEITAFTIHLFPRITAQKSGRLGIITGAIADEIFRVLPLVKQATEQSRRAAINGEKVPAKERIFSIFEEHTELLKRGKAHKPCEFGHLVTLAQTAEKFITYYNEVIITLRFSGCLESNRHILK